MATEPASATGWRAFVGDPDHGPLPAALIVLTVVTGLVDAVSILALGRVFVANMTGNVVFVGFALAGAPGFSLAASLSALAGFVAGAGFGGWMNGRLTQRTVLVRAVLVLEAVFVAGALTATDLAASPLGGASRDGIAAALAIALGAQNAVVRHLKVPDLTTTVLTMTLTGIVADIRSASSAVVVRRVLAVAAMLAGAVGGALLALHVSAAAALAVALGLVAATIGFLLLPREPWT